MSLLLVEESESPPWEEKTTAALTDSDFKPSPIPPEYAQCASGAAESRKTPPRRAKIGSRTSAPKENWRLRPPGKSVSVSRRS